MVSEKGHPYVKRPRLHAVASYLCTSGTKGCVYVSMYVGASEVLPERSRETQRASQSLREAQRGPERPREAQRGPERYVCMYVGTYVCKDCEPFQKAKSYCTTQLHLQGRVEQIVHLESCTYKCRPEGLVSEHEECETLLRGLAGLPRAAFRNCICKGHQGGRHWHSQGQVRTSSR